MKNANSNYEKELHELLATAETVEDLELVQSLLDEWEAFNADGGSMTSEAVGKALGVSDRTVRRWWERGCPRDSMESITEWRSVNIKAVAEDAEATEIQLEIRRAELMDKAESARTRKLKNNQFEGRLIERAEVERDTAINIARLVNGLSSLGSMCANVCPSEVKAVISELVSNVVRVRLKEISDSMRAGDDMAG